MLTISLIFGAISRVGCHLGIVARNGARHRASRHGALPKRLCGVGVLELRGLIWGHHGVDDQDQAVQASDEHGVVDRGSGRYVEPWKCVERYR